MLVGIVTSGIVRLAGRVGHAALVRTHSFMPFVIYRVVARRRRARGRRHRLALTARHGTQQQAELAGRRGRGRPAARRRGHGDEHGLAGAPDDDALRRPARRRRRPATTGSPIAAPARHRLGDGDGRPAVGDRAPAGRRRRRRRRRRRSRRRRCAGGPTAPAGTDVDAPTPAPPAPGAARTVGAPGERRRRARGRRWPRRRRGSSPHARRASSTPAAASATTQAAGGGEGDDGRPVQPGSAGQHVAATGHEVHGILPIVRTIRGMSVPADATGRQRRPLDVAVASSRRAAARRRRARARGRARRRARRARRASTMTSTLVSLLAAPSPRRARRRRRPRRRAAAVGLVEPAALERDADGREHLLHRHHRAGGRVRGLGEGVVGEGLLDLDRLAGVDEPVDVRGHRVANATGRGRPTEARCGMVRPMQVRSAVIPAAGMGTRFLPASKAVPKELLPIGDTPTLQLVIDEALGAGIEHIVVVSSRSKPAIEAYFAAVAGDPRRARGERQDGARRAGPQHRLGLAGDDRLPGRAARPRPRRRLRQRGDRRRAVRRAAPRRADGRLVAARPDERRLRQHRRQRRGAQGGAPRGGRALRRDRPDRAGRRRRRRADRRHGREAAGRRGAERPHHHRPLRAHAGRLRRDRRRPHRRARRDPAHRRPAGPGRTARRSTASSASIDRFDTGTPFGFLTAAIELGLRDPATGAELRTFLDDLPAPTPPDSTISAQAGGSGRAGRRPAPCSSTSNSVDVAASRSVRRQRRSARRS